MSLRARSAELSAEIAATRQQNESNLTEAVSRNAQLERDLVSARRELASLKQQDHENTLSPKATKEIFELRSKMAETEKQNERLMALKDKSAQVLLEFQKMKTAVEELGGLDHLKSLAVQLAAAHKNGNSAPSPDAGNVVVLQAENAKFRQWFEKLQVEVRFFPCYCADSTRATLISLL